ncbi:hypothetical protein [Hippea alviniae]|uniref:hypothetical protein n=1 Tax=Hippea alviniae TaxID=1279027 RepID=UPI0003B6B3BA|nr:hypothetical protein [Hippea alviniae]
MKSSNLEEFIEKAHLNGIEVVGFKEIESILKDNGYKDEDYFKNNEIGVIKAISANSKEANALIDVSDKDKLTAALDIEILYIIIEEKNIKDSMFEAYKLATPQSDYLIFIGAESKTADIEKQLVSGVQGAKKIIFVIK